MTPTPRPKLSRLPFILLGLMSLFSFGGPIAFGYVLAGGPSNHWPPDRPIEWVTLIGISAAVVVLMLACLSLALKNHKVLASARSPENESAESRSES